MPTIALPDGRDLELEVSGRARVLGWAELRVREAMPGNKASHRLFAGLGFVLRDAGPAAYVLPLAPLGGRPRR
jgi:hypothetical protein